MKATLSEMKQERNVNPLQEDIDLLDAFYVAIIEEGLLVYYHPFTIGLGAIIKQALCIRE